MVARQAVKVLLNHLDWQLDRDQALVLKLRPSQDPRLATEVLVHQAPATLLVYQELALDQPKLPQKLQPHKCHTVSNN